MAGTCFAKTVSVCFLKTLVFDIQIIVILALRNTHSCVWLSY